MTGIELIAAERQRQIAVEGWTPEHDDQHIMGEMAAAAMCYSLNARALDAPQYFIEEWWPWDMDQWKPTDPLRNLVKAGALIAAEIDRLKRVKICSLCGRRRQSKDCPVTMCGTNEDDVLGVENVCEECYADARLAAPEGGK